MNNLTVALYLISFISFFSLLFYFIYFVSISLPLSMSLSLSVIFFICYCCLRCTFRITTFSSISWTYLLCLSAVSIVIIKNLREACFQSSIYCGYLLLLFISLYLSYHPRSPHLLDARFSLPHNSLCPRCQRYSPLKGDPLRNAGIPFCCALQRIPLLFPAADTRFCEGRRAPNASTGGGEQASRAFRSGGMQHYTRGLVLKHIEERLNRNTLPFTFVFYSILLIYAIMYFSSCFFTYFTLVIYLFTYSFIYLFTYFLLPVLVIC